MAICERELKGERIWGRFTKVRERDFVWKMKWERESLEEKCVSVCGLGRDRTKRRETLRV